MDWAYAKQRIYALTLELARPVSVQDGCYLPDDELAIELERNRDALLWFLEQAQTLDAVGTGTWWR